MELINTPAYFSYGVDDIVISFELQDDTAIIDYIKYPQRSIQLFMVCLKGAISKLIGKNIFTKLIQYVPKEDWDMYLAQDTDWKHINTYTQDNANIYVIECDINNAISCVARGLGIYEQGTNYKTILEL